MLVSEDNDTAALFIDAAGIVISWNDRCEQLFGIPASRALGLDLARLLDVPDGQMLLERWAGLDTHCDALELSIPQPGDGNRRSAELTQIGRAHV